MGGSVGAACVNVAITCVFCVYVCVRRACETYKLIKTLQVTMLNPIQ